MRSNVRLFFLCAALVFLIQFVLLQPVIQYRLFNRTEDWPYLVYYKSLYPNPLGKIVDVWTHGWGLHTTAEVYYAGIVESLVGPHYQTFNILNVVLKGFAALTLFPLILVVFKNKLLAFLSAILYAINPAPAGSLLWMVRGGEFLAVISLNLFLLVYYFIFTKNQKRLLILSAVLFLITYLFAPPRLFPLFFLIPLIEIFWLLKTNLFGNIKFSIMRMIIFFLPAIFISLLAPVSNCCPFTKGPTTLVADIVGGNWDNIFYPFTGIGYSLFTNSFLKYFGQISTETFSSFGNYLDFLLIRPMFVFAILTAIISLISNKPKKFFWLVLITNLGLDILMYFFSTLNSDLLNHISQSNPYLFLISKYATLIGLYIFVVSFYSFLEWRGGKGSNLLMAVWVGPIFSAIFLWPTWLIMGYLLGFKSSVNWYLILPSIGISLFTAAILTLIYEKFKIRKINGFIISFILFILIIFYHASSVEITAAFMIENPEAVKISDQEKLHDKLIKQIDERGENGNLLIYLDFANDKFGRNYYLEALVMTDNVYGNEDFGSWFQLRREKGAEGCVAAIADKEKLKKIFNTAGSPPVFMYHGNCRNYQGIPIYGKKDSVLYHLDDFRAFRIEGGEFINIREQVLDSLYW